LKLDANIAADRITQIVEIPFIFKNALAPYKRMMKKFHAMKKNIDDSKRNLGFSVSRA